MKLKNEFITHMCEDEQIMVSAGSAFSGLVRSNRTAAYIVDCLKTETTPEEIISRMLEKYDAPEDVISADVNRILEKLRSIGALDEQVNL